ncbi:hypothetical protein LshimejAT787_1200510 [Lyophyllum shimeji]|uniref:Uncharacterized protein n=1 Tax=Lyophyllum shimeji TaxID=47721 RepID=A0A9P3PWK9_LYOSH|nr:hypothetical protein LshimejAT787_1200510 [Lyophyllum shimeji]
MKFSAIFVALPIILASGSALAQGNPEVEARDLAALTRDRLVARQAREWDIYRRDFEPSTLERRRKCKTSQDCLGMICINGTCQ